MSKFRGRNLQRIDILLNEKGDDYLRKIIILVLTLLLLTSCNARELKPTEYNETKWGMTEKEVKEIETGALVSETKYTLKYSRSDSNNELDLLLPLDVEIKYEFLSKKLAEIDTTINDESINNDSYKTVKNKLISLYGKPEKNDGEIRTGDKKEYLFMLYSTWTVNDTDIFLYINYNKVLNNAIGIKYSRELSSDEIEMLYQQETA